MAKTKTHARRKLRVAICTSSASNAQLWRLAGRRAALRAKSRFALQISSGVHMMGTGLVGISHQCISNERFGPRRHRTQSAAPIRGLAAAAASWWWLLEEKKKTANAAS
jgi:hypothetical protein